MPDQIEYWNSHTGRRWAENQRALDRAIRAFGEVALQAAEVGGGQSVLDVGTGCGDTALALAERVGPSGKVWGIDISAPMLEVARSRAESLPNVDFVMADATHHRFEQSFDRVFSRFGVMFFPQPVAAFTNLRTHLSQHGRLTFVCWGPTSENPWFALPIETLCRVWPQAPVAPPDDGPGPFSLADPDKIRDSLQNAGFAGIHIDKFDAEMVFGEDLEQAVNFAQFAGPAARLLADAPPSVVERLQPALAEVFRDRLSLRGSAWIVTAKLSP